MKLYSYYRSSCSWRVRIVLHLKGVTNYEYVPVNLLKGEQNADEYLRVNPSGLVPTLVLDDGTCLSQSVAIMEYLEEAIVDGPKLLPADPLLRAVVRQAVMIIAADTQPLQNLRIVRAMGEGGPEWARSVIHAGLKSFQELVLMGRRTGGGGKYSVGDSVTLADVVLVPQLYNARRFGVDLEEFGELVAIEQRLAEVEAFRRAAPEMQPDYPVIVGQM
jgi:maleylacetoacetate isomerase